MRWPRIVLLACVAAIAVSGWWSREAPRDETVTQEVTTTSTASDTSGLPAEALETLRHIEAGGPFDYDRDGSIFQNREGRLPPQPRGYYREYTVTTPGSRDRGARRIVIGGDPPAVFYYTDDHYRSFRRIEAPRS